MDKDTAFSACKCDATEELDLLREEMQLRDNEIALLL